jgi:hypothetical protein
VAHLVARVGGGLLEFCDLDANESRTGAQPQAAPRIGREEVDLIERLVGGGDGKGDELALGEPEKLAPGCGPEHSTRVHMNRTGRAAGQQKPRLGNRHMVCCLRKPHEVVGRLHPHRPVERRLDGARRADIGDRLDQSPPEPRQSPGGTRPHIAFSIFEEREDPIA